MVLVVEVEEDTTLPSLSSCVTTITFEEVVDEEELPTLQKGKVHVFCYFSHCGGTLQYELACALFF